MEYGELEASNYGDGKHDMGAGTNEKMSVRSFEQEETVNGRHDRPVGEHITTVHQSAR